VVGSTCPGDKINYVDSDNRADSQNAVQWLIKRGHRRIAFVGSPLRAPTFRLRFQGYKAALKESGLDYAEELVLLNEPFSADLPTQVFEVFRKGNRVSAVFASDRTISLKTFELLGDRLADLEFAAYDDFNGIFGRFGVPYARIEQPLGEIGKRAIDGLYRLFKEPKAPLIQVRLPSKLVLPGQNPGQQTSPGSQIPQAK
ncbi:MAG: substrate-binding domain-containing protein, partial [Verrucomicrobiae bacterium]|nr:substrate-binding domain-containing protein [Verrucomicrobiae bacterium]